MSELPFMLPVVIRNLFSKPFTVKHPFERREPFPEHRGRIDFDMEKCDLCQDCERVCPSVAIKVDPEAGVIIYDPFKCIYCHECVQTCMQRAISKDSKYTEPAYVKEVKYYKKKF
ncbi:MAG: 4Fe-4S binding protein [Candidatus Korarchaeum sp.]|nr:4Fe-4S binding protein [Candidatus Korarchaeum sp.]MDW8035560.1 4Fe-4S binding protein [Candidatus Korarchaeum sp.]